MDDEADGILNIALSDSESEDQPSSQRPSRTDQTEEAYQLVKKTYSVKLENGDIYKGVKLPLDKGVKKAHIQEVIYAAEELYYFKKFQEAIDFLDKVLSEGADRSEAFDDATRSLLTMYRQKCERRLVNQKKS